MALRAAPVRASFDGSRERAERKHTHALKKAGRGVTGRLARPARQQAASAAPAATRQRSDGGCKAEGRDGRAALAPWHACCLDNGRDGGCGGGVGTLDSWPLLRTLLL